MDKTVVWALFDSGNGCYAKGAKDFSNIDVYPIGIDMHSNNDHFTELNLADYSLKGESVMFKTLDKLPHPDVILASPPCESFSVASAMWGGNACWKQEDKKGSRFVVRNQSDYTTSHFKKQRYNYSKQFITRINGELCAYNTIEIIKRYKPKIHVIENPYSSRIWDYISEVMGFDLEYANPTFYGNYNYPIKKPTKFKSNINLNLKFNNYYAGVCMNDVFSHYNDKSNIPKDLIKDIYIEINQYFSKNNRVNAS